MEQRTVVQLVLRACDGDEVAFAALCRQFAGMLHNAASDYYAPGLDRDDLLQEARIALHAATVSYDPATHVPFPAFASLVVRRRLMSVVKLANAGKHRPLWQARFEEPIGDANDGTLADVILTANRDDPEYIVLQRDELRRLVRGLTTKLTPTEAAVLARRLDGCSLTEAGQGLGRAQSAAKTADNAMQRVQRKARLAIA